MKKIYYKVMARILEPAIFIGDGVGYFCTCFNTGYVIIENNEFIGFLTLDSFSGFYNGESLAVDIIDFNNDEEYMVFSEAIDSFELPATFVLKSENPDDDRICQLIFKNSIKDFYKQKEIEDEKARIHQLHNLD